MSTVERLALLLALGLPAAAGAADRAMVPALGRPATPEQVAAWNLSIYPDGRGLPPGRGTAVEGKAVYEKKCAACHGEKGTGGPGGHLVGRGPLTGEDADKTIGSYWPYATTVFDFIRRSMPMDAPGSLSADEIYAVTAYLLQLNDIVGANDEMNPTTLPRVKMPNRDGFVWIDAKPHGGGVSAPIMPQ